jgi:hypothetical protein
VFPRWIGCANMCSMTAQGSPLTRMRRAIQGGSVEVALLEAAGLRHVGLDDALALCLLLRGDRRYDAAARRWLVRLLTEAGGVTLSEVADAAAAFSALADRAADARAPLNVLRGCLRRRGMRLAPA